MTAADSKQEDPRSDTMPSYSEVTVYSRKNCPDCAATKIYMRKHDVPFTEVDITYKPIISAALIEQGFKQVPVVEWFIDGTTGSWTGFHSESIENLAHLIKGDQ
ncbi:glutaredoxin family protein [Nocardia brasiliensis]|uniref:glutaredoxin family protein n=1 Tax=Nocardia brasiliensis TaxID=37326 RepID=UPI0024562A11|nr:glutaredoxin domain-containing protein [Nocardia brasiliensis]